MVYAYREATGGSPLDSDVAEGLEEFFATRDPSVRRVKVSRLSPSQWSLRGRDATGQYRVPLPPVMKDSDGYRYEGKGASTQPTLLDAVHGALSGYA